MRRVLLEKCAHSAFEWRNVCEIVPLASKARQALNSLLSRLDLRLETLTKERAERVRLTTLDSNGHFDRPVFPLPRAICEMRPDGVFELLRRYSTEFAKFNNVASNGTGFSYQNAYYSSPDAEVLYAMVRGYRPPFIVEVGSGNSTMLARQAILDEGSFTKIVCVDPAPRVGIAAFADRIEQRPVEDLTSSEIVEMLAPGSLLFIDSSHFMRSGGDVAFLYFNVLPALPVGTIVHIHDVFLPYDYPKAWVMDYGWGWNEQYLVQAMLAFGARFEVLWAAHYLQKTRPDFPSYFRHTTPGIGSSLWLRVRPE